MSFVSQCTARSKQTGEQCKRLVRGGGVCRWHGGAAPQVERHREIRIVKYEAHQEAAEQGFPPPRDAAEALMSALSDSDAVVQKLKEMIGSGVFDPAQIEALGSWLDRVGRLSKLVIDSKLDERKVRRDEQTAKMIADAIRGVLAELELTPEQQRLVPIVVPRQLRVIAGSTVK